MPGKSWQHDDNNNFILDFEISEDDTGVLPDQSLAIDSAVPVAIRSPQHQVSPSGEALLLNRGGI
jgi:hypothetical protein